MPLASRRSRRSSIDIWPGFVDALAQLLMVIIFMLLVFTAGQFFLSDALSGRDKALQELQQQISELSDLLALERSSGRESAGRSHSRALASRLQATLAERDAAQSRQLARADAVRPTRKRSLRRTQAAANRARRRAELEQVRRASAPSSARKGLAAEAARRAPRARAPRSSS